MRPFSIPAILLLVTVTIFSCSKKDSAPVSTNVLTVTVTDDFMASLAVDSADFWLFASDKSGQVLDTHEITASGTYNFVSTTADDSISVTEFMRYPDSGASDFSVSSFFLKRNDAITLDQVTNRATKIPDATGSASIAITNFSMASYLGFGLIFLTDGYYGYPLGGVVGGSSLASFPLRADTSSILISTHDANNQPIYSLVHNVKNGDQIKLDFSTFLPFPKTFDVPEYTTLFVDVSGYYNRQSGYPSTEYIMTNIYLYTPGLHPICGYLPGFDGYTMTVNTGKGSYNKRGAINPSFAIPSRNITVSNGDFQNPVISTDGVYTYGQHEWQTSLTNIRTIHWFLFSAPGVAMSKISALPPALQTKYPTFDLTKLVYSRTMYIDDVGGHTYQQSVNDRLTGTIRSSYEFYTWNN